jgi:O-antigen ligase
MWKIGTELISEYPLGIGYHNSGVLRRFSLEIPQELKHFHNNLINIAAESGLLTAAIFMWFIIAVVRGGMSAPRTSIRVGIACAFISWQAAGLVEYNFGDSEVMIVAWILLGVLLSDLRRNSTGETGAPPETTSARS